MSTATSELIYNFVKYGILTTPLFSTQDINQLQTDLPKWKPWLSDRSWEEWTDFLERGIEKLQQVPSVPPEWPIETLKSSAACSDNESERQDHSFQDTILLTKERQECLVRLKHNNMQKKLVGFGQTQKCSSTPGGGVCD